MGILKTFTLEEANQLIPKLSDLIQELQKKRHTLFKEELEIDALEIVTKKQDQETPPALNEKIGIYNKSVSRFYEAMEDVHVLGCRLKDIDRGEIDFYSSYRGRSVFLCWAYPEKEIMGWHEIGRECKDRKPLWNEGA